MWRWLRKTESCPPALTQERWGSLDLSCRADGEGKVERRVISEVSVAGFGHGSDGVGGDHEEGVRLPLFPALDDCGGPVAGRASGTQPRERQGACRADSGVRRACQHHAPFQPSCLLFPLVQILELLLGAWVGGGAIPGGGRRQGRMVSGWGGGQQVPSDG